MKNFILGALAAVVVLALGALGYFGLGFAAVGADAKPSAWEARLMDSAVHASVRRQAPRVQNPLAPRDETLIAGGRLYLNDCVGCHGAPGGPSTKFPITFYPQVPQFPLVDTKYLEAEVFWVAKHGIRRTGMFPQGSNYTDTELWSLSAFITRIKNLSPGVLQGIQQQSK
jgi:mono/diheme cytochrome c family protein